jgi:hypothetical protein
MGKNLMWSNEALGWVYRPLMDFFRSILSWQEIVTEKKAMTEMGFWEKV